MKIQIQYETVKTHWGAYRTPASAICGQTHSGSHNLALDQGSFQCAGCGAWYTRPQVESPFGEMGQGGVVAR